MDVPLFVIALFYGIVGSLAHELLLGYRSIGPHGALPRKYHSRKFWFFRGSLAIVAGVIATSIAKPGTENYVYVMVGLSLDSVITRLAATPHAVDTED